MGRSFQKGTDGNGRRVHTSVRFVELLVEKFYQRGLIHDKKDK